MIGILGFYKEMSDLVYNAPLIYGLDKVAETVKKQKEDCTNMFDPEVTFDYAKSRVSEEALNEARGKEDIEVATGDANLFKFDNFQFNVVNEEVSKLFRGYQGGIGVSGRHWYPPAGYMGWHTNSNSIGYRLYCSHSEEEDSSFFRFLDPITNEIVTSWDKKGWNFRLFQVIKDVKFWHCVYSETDRVSIGYNLNLGPIQEIKASQDEIKEETVCEEDLKETLEDHSGL